MARFLSDPEFLALTRLNISAAPCNEALYSPMIAVVGLLGPLPRSDNSLQATYTPGTCQTSMRCHQKCSKNFVNFISAASCNEALYSPMIVAVGLFGPLPRSAKPLQA